MNNLLEYIDSQVSDLGPDDCLEDIKDAINNWTTFQSKLLRQLESLKETWEADLQQEEDEAKLDE